MEIVSRLKKEVQELHALECGVAHVLHEVGRAARHRRVAETAVSLTEATERHMDDLARVCADEGWTDGGCDSAEVRAWSEEAEGLVAARDEMGDFERLALLRRAVHLKIPRYETARLLAFHADRPALARLLRLAAEDERRSEAGIARLAELAGMPHPVR